MRSVKRSAASRWRLTCDTIGQPNAGGPGSPRVRRGLSSSPASSASTPDDLTERIAKAERRRLRMIFGALALILAVVSTLAVVAWVQRNNAVEQSLIATTRQLAATAKTTAETDLQSALLLADTAYKTRAEPQTIQALHDVVTETPQLVGFYDFGEPVTMVDGTPDAGVLVGGTESGTVLRLDRSTGTVTEVMALDAPIEFLSVSDDGKTIAATGTRYDENSLPESSQSAVWHDGGLTPSAR